MEKQRSRLPIILLFCWITYTAAYLCRVNISTALDKLSVGMSVSVEYLGMASSVYFVTYAVGQLLNGFIGDRVNPYRYIMLALLLTGGINAVLGVQSSGAVFLVLWGLNGIVQSMFWCTLLRLLSVHAAEHQRKNVSTVMSTTSVTGYLLSWVVLSDLFAPASYAPYFAVPGLLALLLVPAWFVLSRSVPFESAAGLRTETPSFRAVLGEIRHDRLHAVCFLCLVVGAIQEGAVFWLPMLFTDVFRLGGESLLLMLIPLAKLAGVFLARSVLTALGSDLRRAELTMLGAAFGLVLLLLATCRTVSLLTVVLIAMMIAVINGANWYMISYLPLHFSERNIVSSLVGTFDFSTYIGASLMSGALGVLLLRFGWVALPIAWTALILLAILLAATCAGGCLRLCGKRRA